MTQNGLKHILNMLKCNEDRSWPPKSPKITIFLKILQNIQPWESGSGPQDCCSTLRGSCSTGWPGGTRRHKSSPCHSVYPRKVDWFFMTCIQSNNSCCCTGNKSLAARVHNNIFRSVTGNYVRARKYISIFSWSEITFVVASNVFFVS